MGKGNAPRYVLSHFHTDTSTAFRVAFHSFRVLLDFDPQSVVYMPYKQRRHQKGGGGKPVIRALAQGPCGEELFCLPDGKHGEAGIENKVAHK
jgi:hypothetical protein